MTDRPANRASADAAVDYLVSATPTQVEAWSTVQLQLESYGRPYPFKDELRTAIHGLIPERGALLHAIYQSPVRGFVDTENVLFYNVGQGPFGLLMTTGVRFERDFGSVAVPKKPAAVPEKSWTATPKHYLKYSMQAPYDPFTFWTEGPALAGFDAIPLRSIGEVAPVFIALRRNAAPPLTRAFSKPPLHPGPFGLQLTIRPPAGAPRKLAGYIKCLIDGVVSAYHQHSGRDLALVSSRFERAGYGFSKDFEDALVDPAWNVLGTRDLVRAAGAGKPRFNPADELCVAADIRLGEPLTGSGWEISGRLFEILPRFAHG